MVAAIEAMEGLRGAIETARDLVAEPRSKQTRDKHQHKHTNSASCYCTTQDSKASCTEHYQLETYPDHAKQALAGLHSGSASSAGLPAVACVI